MFFPSCGHTLFCPDLLMQIEDPRLTLSIGTFLFFYCKSFYSCVSLWVLASSALVRLQGLCLPPVPISLCDIEDPRLVSRVGTSYSSFLFSWRVKSNLCSLGSIETMATFSLSPAFKESSGLFSPNSDIGTRP